MDKIIKQVINQFNIDESLPIQQIAQNLAQNQTWMIGDKYILKSFSSDIENTKKVVKLNALLFEENAPVARYYKSQMGDFYVFAEESYYTLADKLPGTSDYSIYEGNSQKRVYSLGKNLAKLHLALKKLDGKIQVENINTMDELNGWILKEIRDKKIAVKQEVIDYCIKFGDLYHRLPKQIIHRDPHSGNTLLQNDEITGFIDFDISQVNTRVFDMSYAFSPYEDSYDNWLVHRSSFFSGYNEVSSLSEDEVNAYPYMCILIELLFTAFWSTINRDDKIDESLRRLHWLYSIREDMAGKTNGRRKNDSISRR